MKQAMRKFGDSQHVSAQKQFLGDSQHVSAQKQFLRTYPHV